MPRKLFLSCNISRHISDQSSIKRPCKHVSRWLKLITNNSSRLPRGGLTDSPLNAPFRLLASSFSRDGLMHSLLPNSLVTIVVLKRIMARSAASFSFLTSDLVAVTLLGVKQSRIQNTTTGNQDVISRAAEFVDNASRRCGDRSWYAYSVFLVLEDERALRQTRNLWDPICENIP